MDGHHNEKGSNFTTGLLLGLLIGISITLLVVTKKGRRLLKTLADEGFENMKDWKSRLKEAETMVDEDLYLDEIEEQSDIPITKTVESVSTAPKPTNGIKKHAKKLFRGIPKKS